MKIGVIGLGSIAQKAYLPVYTTQFPQHEWHFSTRTGSTLKQIGDMYGLSSAQLHTDWRKLTDIVDAVCIHTPTKTHLDIARVFLENKIPVFIDKPVTESMEETRELIRFAEETGTMLMTGFNRRFAPMVDRLKEVPDKNHLILQKNQVDKTDFSVRYKIYDAMIHPIDTALYLLEMPAKVRDSKVIVKNNQFLRAWVMLETENTTAYVSMNNQTGTKREIFEVQSDSQTVILENLTELTAYTESEESKAVINYWTTTLEKRGFVPMIEAFISAVGNDTESPVSLPSVLASHDVCEAIVAKFEEKRNTLK